MRAKTRDLTTGGISKGLWLFAAPLMLGNVLQQFYNLADTWVVGRYIGSGALAAVGSSYTLLTFLTSVVIGLSLGTGAYISQAFGRGDGRAIRGGVYMSFLLTGGLSLLLTGAFYALVDPVIRALRIPPELWGDTRCYLCWVFPGFFATFLYNFLSNVLRGMGNSTAPLVFLALAVALNVGLDLYFVIALELGVRGAAAATVIAQYASGGGLLLYYLLACPEYRVRREDMAWSRERLRHILSLSGLTCLQQSAMNFGILLVQGVVNSFGPVVMAAFAVAVKIDTIAYMPVQDFGNAFSVFVAQNYGAGKKERIRAGIRQGAVSVAVFCAASSGLVCLLAPELMGIFVDAASGETIRVGAEYLRIEGLCYIGIGLLFMLYGYYRAVDKPGMSLVLTVLSLGTRVVLANVLAPVAGPVGIWAAIPIGWALADGFGIWYHYKREGKRERG